MVSSMKLNEQLEIGRLLSQHRNLKIYIYIRLCTFGNNKKCTSDRTYTVKADVNLAELHAVGSTKLKYRLEITASYAFYEAIH